MKSFFKKFLIIFISLTLACGLSWSYISTYIKNVILIELIKEFKESGIGELEYKDIKNEFSPFGFKFKIVYPEFKLNSVGQKIILKSNEIIIKTDFLIKDISITAHKIFDINQDQEITKITYENNPEVKIELSKPIILNFLKDEYKPEYKQIKYNSAGFTLSKNQEGKLISVATIINENMVIDFDEKYANSKIEFSIKNLTEPMASLGKIKFLSSSKTAKANFDFSKSIQEREYIIDQISFSNNLFNINFTGKFNNEASLFKLNLRSYNKMIAWLNNFLEKWQVEYVNEKIMKNGQQLENDSIEIILENGLFGKQTFQDLIQQYLMLLSDKLKEKLKP